MNVALKAILILSVSLTCFQVKAAPVTIMGAYSCGKWIDAREKKRDALVQTWVMGFLSGVSAALEVDSLKDTDSDAIALWMDNYCRKNPLSYTEEAGTALFFELAKKKGLKFPKIERPK